MSKQDSESDVNVDETQHQENSYTPETLQNNTTMHDKHNLIHDEYDTSENDHIIEIETTEHYGEKIHEPKIVNIYRNISSSYGIQQSNTS